MQCICLIAPYAADQCQEQICCAHTSLCHKKKGTMSAQLEAGAPALQMSNGHDGLSVGATAGYALGVVALVLGAGLMSGLTLGLLSLDVMDLEVSCACAQPTARLCSTAVQSCNPARQQYMLTATAAGGSSQQPTSRPCCGKQTACIMHYMHARMFILDAAAAMFFSSAAATARGCKCHVGLPAEKIRKQ